MVLLSSSLCINRANERDLVFHLQVVYEASGGHPHEGILVQVAIRTPVPCPRSHDHYCGHRLFVFASHTARRPREKSMKVIATSPLSLALPQLINKQNTFARTIIISRLRSVRKALLFLQNGEHTDLIKLGRYKGMNQPSLPL